MPYIKNKDRNKLIDRINDSYGLRKVLIIIEMLLLIGFIVVTFVSIANADSKSEDWWWQIGGEWTTLGKCMFAWAIVMGVLGLISMILIITMRSPKKTKKDIVTLENSPLSGKKVKNYETSAKVFKDRTTTPEPKKDNKKGKKGKK